MIMKIGKRLIKSLISTLLCFAIAPLLPQGALFYSAISALQCLQIDQKSTKSMAMQRTMGTFIGAFYGLGVQLLAQTGQFSNESYIYYLVVAFITMMVLYTASRMGFKNSAYFSAVVFLSITAVHRGDNSLLEFVLSRVVATLAGVAIGIGVNSFELPRIKQKDVLLVSGLDGTLFKTGEKICDSTRIMLNRMIDQGALFTVASLRTPASIIEATPGINLDLPVVACNGAILYDIKKNKYLKSMPIGRELGHIVSCLLKSQGIHVFTNCLIDDVLLIYYGEFNNPVEKEIFDKCKTSPYRNYVHESHYLDASKPLYYMAIDKTEKLDKAVDALKNAPFARQIKVLFHPAPGYPGYSFLKVYRHDVSKSAMLEYLQVLIKAKSIVTCGSIENQYDIFVEEGDFNTTITRLERVFKPLWPIGINPGFPKPLDFIELIFFTYRNIIGKNV